MGCTHQVGAGSGGQWKNAHKAEQKREKFTEYTSGKRRTGQQRRGSLPQGRGEGGVRDHGDITAWL